MKFRWSGSVRQPEEEVRQRIRRYFERIGFRTLEEAPTLSLQRGETGLHLDPRRIWMRIEARVQGWGAETLVDITFELASRRLLSETGAELLVSEVREMTRYLQNGDADFERLETLQRRAVRELRAILITAVGVAVVLSVGAAYLLYALRWTGPLAPVLGGLLVGLVAGYLYARMGRFRKR
ncbi:MAG: hypothetical protein N2045_00545 [Fimbriimonadales bacterium]|nr:hypothetical protein [Fimbriimonadales bacterium]